MKERKIQRTRTVRRADVDGTGGLAGRQTVKHAGTQAGTQVGWRAGGWPVIYRGRQEGRDNRQPAGRSRKNK